MVDRGGNAEYYLQRIRPGRAFKIAKNYTMIQYFKDVRSEMKHVSWPTQRQAAVYTAVVIAISLATAIYLGLWDYLFTTIIKRII